MAETSSNFDFTSHETALCIIPPQHLWSNIDRLRSLYDKSHGSWPPHINLIYPFVQPALLQDVADILIKLDLDSFKQKNIHLDRHDAFVHKQYNTLFLRPDDESTSTLRQLRDRVAAALHHDKDKDSNGFQPHLSVAQSDDVESDTHKFLAHKVDLLAPVEWEIGHLAILIRQRAESSNNEKDRRMRLWGTVELSSSGQLNKGPATYEPNLWLKPVNDSGDAVPQPMSVYHFNTTSDTWETFKSASTPSAEDFLTPKSLVVASYNVLAEFQWPPSTSRHPALVANLVSDRAAADILVLEEVSDQFLPFLLNNNEIRERYPFVTHGPPGQDGIGPLPSLLNVVVLSKYEMTWYDLPLLRKHKGCTVVTFPKMGFRDEDETFRPWVLVACHLSQGLMDGAVVTKSKEMNKIVHHLTSRYPQHPWILAGDFNLTTSSYTIDAARKKQDISSQTLQYLYGIDRLLADVGFHDTWLVTRLESGESSNMSAGQGSVSELFEGEQGATFDPQVNSLAAELMGSGLNNRPQRYDRILVKADGSYWPRGFNMFSQNPYTSKEGVSTFASDHWGIRCLLMHAPRQDKNSHSAHPEMVIEPFKAPESLEDISNLKRALEDSGSLVTEEDRVAREKVVEDLRRVLVDSGNIGPDGDGRSGVQLILVPVGSFGLGLWTRSSDIDCLCLGDISNKTFFALAIQRLNRAKHQGFKILRRVKANSGTMLELEVHSVKVDLQYCGAAYITHTWPEAMKRPTKDPIFALPFQTLSKLKPVRDLFYLRRSIPDMAQYRLAHLFIKAWAKARGIYSAKFGYLGGIHISVLLVPICKSLASRAEPSSTSDILATFFNHYAGFDWKSRAVFDPFFHKEVKYGRTFREALCLLGWHAPALNTALNASVPTVTTMANELARSNALLSKDGVAWADLLSNTPNDTAGASGAEEFLCSYKSYVKIDVHYWGTSREKGNRFIGWLESRCVMLLVDIDRKQTGIAARIWPARFSDASAALGNDGEFHGSYLVGLSRNEAVETTQTSVKEQAKKSQETLQMALQDFETRIRKDEKYYDAGSSYMTATVIRASELVNVKLDTSSWGADAGESDIDDSEDELEEEEEEEDDDDDNEIGENLEFLGRSKKQREEAASKKPKSPGLGKFRTAADVMNRLRWDTSFDSNDFIIGYEDRFVGAVEKALGLWKTEQTDEEFIPQHRILYFKRKSDGVIFWERRTWTDHIFGSGIKTS